MFNTKIVCLIMISVKNLQISKNKVEVIYLCSKYKFNEKMTVIIVFS